jgi:hypothetical protein
MSNDTDRQLEESTQFAIAKLERLREQMVETMNAVQSAARVVRDSYHSNTNPDKVGRADTFRTRFALEHSVEGLRDELTRTRKYRTEHIALLEETISSGRAGLADMIADDPTDPKIAVHRHHLAILEELLARNAAILKMCDDADAVVVEADEIIVTIQ